MSWTRAAFAICIAGLALGAHMASGVLGAIVLVVLAALFGVGYAGIGILVALRTRNVQATNTSFLLFFPLLFLTPNLVPRELLTRPMEIAATINPVTYIMEAARSLILEDFDWAAIGRGYLVVAISMVLMLALSVRVVSRYD